LSVETRDGQGGGGGEFIALGVVACSGVDGGGGSGDYGRRLAGLCLSISGAASGAAELCGAARNFQHMAAMTPVIKASDRTVSGNRIIRISYLVQGDLSCIKQPKTGGCTT